MLVGELCNLAALRKDRRLSFLAFRAYLGCHLMVASRCQAKRSVRYTLGELAGRLGGGVGEARLRKAVRELEDLEILSFSESKIAFREEILPEAREMVREMGTSPARPVPLPRRLFRALVRNTRPSELISAIAHLIRCLFKRGRSIHGRGFVKASWVARVFGVAERSVHAARRWLIEQGFLKSITVHQLVMNRHGACFEVDLGAGAPTKDTTGRSEFAPPRKKIRSCTSTFLNQKNNKPAVGGRAGFLRKSIRKVSLKDVHPDDIGRVSSLMELFGQAVCAGVVQGGEAARVNFVAAAVRAKHATSDPRRRVRVFLGIVRRGLFHHITQAEEDRALDALRRYREKRRRGAASASANSTRISALVSSVSVSVDEAVKDSGADSSGSGVACAQLGRKREQGERFGLCENRKLLCDNLLHNAPRIPGHTALVGVCSAGCEIPSCV